MALIPIVLGGALILGGSLAASNAAKRKPLPDDLRAQVLAAFRSNNQDTIAKVLTAIKTGAGGKYSGQATVLGNAIQRGLSALTETSTVPEDIRALWWAAIASADPSTMRRTSLALKPKYPALASALLDCARILGG
jgi:hypothetical protein